MSKNTPKHLWRFWRSLLFTVVAAAVCSQYFSVRENTCAFIFTAADLSANAIVWGIQLQRGAFHNAPVIDSQPAVAAPRVTAVSQPIIELLPPPPAFTPPPVRAFTPPDMTKLFSLPQMLGREKRKAKPVVFAKRKVNGVPYYITVIDLKDPQTYVTLGLANNAKEANSAYVTNGDEQFDSFVKRHHAAVVVNGTFFSKDDEKRVMGNMVSEGKIVKYSAWENYGTTLGIKAGNELEMVTARTEGQPVWNSHWFSVTCGPRLVTRGVASVNAQAEGFADSHVLGVGPRNAIGYPASKDKIYLVSFLRGLSLQQEAYLMKAIGCYDAMNLDGGSSRALSHGSAIVIKAGRPLTNVLVVYDKDHKAPSHVVDSWKEFQRTGMTNTYTCYSP